MAMQHQPIALPMNGGLGFAENEREGASRCIRSSAWQSVSRGFTVLPNVVHERPT